MKTILKIITSLIVIVALIALAIFLYGTYGMEDITLKQADGKEVKQVKINSVIDKIKMDTYSLQLKKVDNKENITINNDIEIKNDTTTIIIDLNNKDYCSYQTPNYKAISKMPKGLYEWAEIRSSLLEEN